MGACMLYIRAVLGLCSLAGAAAQRSVPLPTADKIGSGSYGVVYKVLRKADRMVYAMKEIDLAGMSRKVRLCHLHGLHPASGGIAAPWLPSVATSAPHAGILPPEGSAAGAANAIPPPMTACAQEQEECIRETRVLSSLDSDYIIKYYDSFLERVRGAAWRGCRSQWIGHD